MYGKYIDEGINGDFILGLEFNNYNRFEIKCIPIDRCLKHNEIYTRLRTMQDDGSFLPKDLINYFRKEVSGYRKINYCLPEWYSDTYIGYADPLGKSKDEKLEEESDSYYKGKFISYVERWLNAYDYYQTLDKIKNNDNIKVWSSEAIGWTTFKYIINNDLNVYVSTNFAYGWSSYFHLSLKYKDLLVIPYTDVIHYYHANVVEFRRCTRSYVVDRKSWKYLFEYLEKASNLMISNPNEFVRKYIVCEIDGALRDLEAMQRDVRDNKWGIANRFTIKRNTPLVSGWDMTEVEEKDYLVYHTEMDFLFVIEKIKAVKDVLLDDLNRLKFVYDKVDEIEKRIERIVNSIYPKVEKKVDNLSSELIRKEKEKLNIETKISELKNEFKPIQEKYEEYVRQEDKKLLEYEYNTIPYWNMRKKIEGAIEQYKKDNPKYDKLKEKINKKEEELSQIKRDISKRNNFKDSLDSFLKEYQDSISS